MILVYGTGKVGHAVASLAAHLGIPTHICDDATADTAGDIGTYQHIVPSPGISPAHHIYKYKNVKSELDFAYSFLPDGFTIIAVTGTDGKSTTSWILYNVLKNMYKDTPVYLSGNFDIPFSATVQDILQSGHTHGYIVVEVSSFMAWGIGRGVAENTNQPTNIYSSANCELRTANFISTYSIFSNFRPDHQNWHTTLQEYLDAKMNLCIRSNVRSIYNKDILQYVEKNNLHIETKDSDVYFSGDDDMSSPKYGVHGENIHIYDKIYTLADTHFTGGHNAMNILSIMLCLADMGIDTDTIWTHVYSIEGLAHRIEKIAVHSDITYIDDSKSTSCQSLVAALSSFPSRNVIWIGGGSDKGDTFEGLENILGKIVKYAVLIGATRDILAAKCISANVPYIYAESMHEAVYSAVSVGTAGDTVLLSPGCASFGMFRDYLDRAQQFRDAVERVCRG